MDHVKIIDPIFVCHKVSKKNLTARKNVRSLAPNDAAKGLNIQNCDWFPNGIWSNIANFWMCLLTFSHV